MTKTIRRLKKKIERRNAVVRKNNKAFADMTPAEKRVQIARDVLAFVEQGKLRPRSGRWLGVGGKRVFDDAQGLAPRGLDDDVRLSEYLPTIETCDACAIGGILYCTILRANEITAGQLRGTMNGIYSNRETLTIRETAPIESYLEQFFDKDQLNMIEGAFERRSGAFTHGDLGSQFFRKDYKDDGRSDKTRVRILMRNIIRNKGTFDPDDRRAMR